MLAQEDLTFSPAVRLQLGLRADYFTFNVEDRLEGAPGATLPHASSYSQETILSPKANLVISPARTLDLFFNFGSRWRRRLHFAPRQDLILRDHLKPYSRLKRILTNDINPHRNESTCSPERAPVFRARLPTLCSSGLPRFLPKHSTLPRFPHI